MNEPNERDRLLAQLLAGEISITDGQVQSAMREDPEFAREAEELLELGDELSAGAPVEIEQQEPWTGADQAIADLVARELGPAPKANVVRIWPIWAAAAALLVSLLVWQPWAGQGIVDPNQTLGDGELWPTGEVAFEEFLRRGFAWNVETPSGRRLMLEIEVDDEPIGPPIEVTGTRHLAVPEPLRNAAPDEIYWRVYYERGTNRRKSWPATVTFR